MINLIKKSLLGLGLLALPLGAACGDDTSSVNPCDEHGAEGCRKEGGEVRLEIVKKPDGTSFARATAMFIADQDVDDYVTPTPNVCNVRAETEFWPFAISPGRTYADAGDQITILGDSVADFTFAKGTGTDFLARPHDILYTDTIEGEPGNDLVAADGMFSVQLNGEGPLGELYEDSIYFPSDWDYTGASTHGPKSFVKGEDMLIEWSGDVAWPKKPANFSETMLIAFIDPAIGGPVVLCPTNFRNGEFTIPAETLEKVPANGLFIMGAVSHNPVYVGEREVDFLGQNCRIQPYSVSEPQ